jgi:phosphodiesterase/alkaline phosphatase D-like protein
MINTTGGEARFRFEFFRAGTYTGANTGIPVVLQNVKITSIDLDCSSAAGSYQYTDATGFQKYAMMSPTNLAVQTVPSTNRVRFIANKAGSRSSVPEDQVMLKYDAVQTIEFSFGNVVAAQTNFFGLVFGGWPNGGTPTEYSNQYNTPPTSTDTRMNAYGPTILSLANFGTYNDVDNNPFFSVKLGAPTPNGYFDRYTGSAWESVTANQVILTSEIEKGFLRFVTGVALTSNVSFTVNDGLDDSTNAYTLRIDQATASQTITFANPGTKGLGGGAFASNATASSLDPVTLTSLTPGICSVNTPTSLNITPLAAGTCVIVASQPGGEVYAAAAPVTQEFQIVAGVAPTTSQTITFTRPDSMTVGASAYTTNATASSTLTVTLTTLTPTLCTVSGLTVTPVAAGDCKVEASQAGNTTYLPATKVILTIPVYAVAGGGTAPNVRTTGPKSSTTATDAVTLTGRLDANGVNTNWKFCYKNTDNPSITNGVLGGTTCTSNALLTDNGSANREVTADLSNLDNSMYYYQLVGWHTGSGNVYGGIWKFKPDSRPYIRTNDASSVTEVSATLNGSVMTSSNRNYSITICYSREFKVAADNSGKLTNCDKTSSTNPSNVQSGSFNSVLLNATGLTGSTRYYYQVIADRNGTKTYGNIVQFVTNSPAPTAQTGSATGFTVAGATVNGSISPNGNTVTPKFCVTETYTAGTLTSSHCLTGVLVTAAPNSATGTGSVSVQYTATGLSLGTVYYYQAYGVYGGSTTVQGTIKSFTFGAPVASTQAATDVKVTSGSTWEAVLHGYVNPNGFTSENFFRFSDTSTVDSRGQLDSSTVVTATPATFATRGSISYNLPGLTAGRTYYFQAIGKNSSGALFSYGEVFDFVTAYAPSVTTEAVLSFGIDTATVQGSLNANGALTTGSFCISTSNATTAVDGILDTCLFTIPTSPTTTSGTTNITGDVTGLLQATTYYYQAIGDNSQGTTYGSIRSFTTQAGAPVATTIAATNVANTTATINGRINPGGAATVAKFCWGTSSSLSSCTLTDTVTVVSAASGLTTVSFNLTNLSGGQDYYYRIEGTNSQGSSQGSIFSFKAGAPTAQTLPATGVTATDAVLNGNVKANRTAITSVKFCVSTTSTVNASGDLTCDVANPNGSVTSIANTITTLTPESATITGLTTNTTYFFQIAALTSQETTTGTVLSFTTNAPIGITKSATAVASSSARLNGLVNRVNDSNTSAAFCLADAEDLNPDGTLTTCVQNVNVPDSQLVTLTSDDEVFADAASLIAGNTYFFQIVTNGTNGRSIGQVFSFSTGFAVTFDANGGSGSMNDQVGTTTAALTANAFSKSGSTFTGWATTAGGSVAYADGASYDFTANITLYAVWSAASTPAPTNPPIPKFKSKLTWPNPGAINQGTPLSGSQLNANPEVPSTCIYTPALGTVLAAGTYTLSVVCTPLDTNYEPTSGTVTLVVKAKNKPKLTWFNPTPITNPTPLGGAQLNASANIPGTFTYSPAAGTVLDPGKYPLNVKFSPENKSEYEDIEANVTITVLGKNDKPEAAPTAPINGPETKTAAAAATKIVLQTSGKLDTITVVKTNEPLGVLITATDWSLRLSSTTQFVQGTVQDSNDRVVIEKGNTVTTSGTGFKPFSQVDIWVYSTPTWLGAVITDAYGNFTTTVPMPKALPAGDHTFQAKGMTPESTVRMADVPITLVNPTESGKPGMLKFEVYFGMNSPIVTKLESKRIAKMVKLAQSKVAQGARITIEISGWVQPNPNPGNIKYLSTNRAKNVAAALKALGLKGSYTLKFPGLAKDNIPAARHASVVINWSKSK